MTIHAVLLGSHEPNERVVEIPERATLLGLHRTLQAAFSWTDTQRHYFETSSGLKFGGPGSDTVANEAGITIKEIFPEVGTLVKYFYDLEDNWVVQLEVLAHGGRKRKYAKLQSGVGTSPFDKSGGVDGWAKIKTVAQRMLEEIDPQLTMEEKQVRDNLLTKGPVRKVCHWITQFDEESCARRVARVNVFSEMDDLEEATRHPRPFSESLPTAITNHRSHRLDAAKMEELRKRNATALECIDEIMDVPELSEMIALIKHAKEQDFDRYELAEFATPIFDFLSYVDDEMQGVDPQRHITLHVEDLAEIFELEPDDPRITLTLNEIFISFIEMEFLETIDGQSVELTKTGLRFLANQDDAKLVEFLINQCPVGNGTSILIPLIDILVLLMPGTVARLAVEHDMDEMELRSKLMAQAVITAFPDAQDPVESMDKALSLHNTMLNVTGMIMENPLDPEGPPVILSGAQKFFVKSLLRLDPERLLQAEWQ